MLFLFYRFVLYSCSTVGSETYFAQIFPPPPLQASAACNKMVFGQVATMIRWSIGSNRVLPLKNVCPLLWHRLAVDVGNIKPCLCCHCTANRIFTYIRWRIFAPKERIISGRFSLRRSVSVLVLEAGRSGEINYISVLYRSFTNMLIHSFTYVATILMLRWL